MRLSLAGLIAYDIYTTEQIISYRVGDSLMLNDLTTFDVLIRCLEIEDRLEFEIHLEEEVCPKE